jgi:hypothetical protein
MTPFAIRREIADLVLEALDIAVSRKLPHRETQALMLDVVKSERPDIALGDARVLVDRAWQRLASLGLLAVAVGSD